MKQKWYINDKRRLKEVQKKLDSGKEGFDKYERNSDKVLEQFDGLVSRPYLEAKGRSSRTCKQLSFEEAGKTIRTITGILGKPPDINHNRDMGGHWMPSRHVLWGVDVESGIEVSNALVAAGIKDFWITSANWLTIKMPREFFVSSFLGREDDPKVWQDKQTGRENAAKIRQAEEKLDGKVA